MLRLSSPTWKFVRRFPFHGRFNTFEAATALHRQVGTPLWSLPIDLSRPSMLSDWHPLVIIRRTLLGSQWCVRSRYKSGS